MKNWSILVAVFVLIMKGFVVEARNYSFKHLSCDDGLSSNCVKALLQDSCGFMWIGTKNGLNRYDGTSILRFNCFDKEAKRGNNNISALHEDDDRNIWVGTDRGIYKYNPYKDLFSFVSLKSREGVSAEDWVQDIISDNEGNTWALVPNQGVFKYSGSELEYHSVVDNGRTRRESPISIFVASDGSIYVGTSNSGLFRYDKDLKRFRQVKLASNDNELKGHTLQFIKESEPGKLVICTDVGDIWTLDLDNMQLRELPFSNKGKVYLRSMLCIGDEVWIATQNGLYIINPTKGTEEYIKEDISNPSGLSDNAIYTLYCDANDDIWVGTSFGGVDYYQRGGLTFERYSVGGNEESLSSKRIRGLAQAPNGNILIGTEEAGINLLNPETGEVTHLTNSYRGMERITLVIKRYGDELYTGFARDGLDVISPDGKVRNISFGAQEQDNSVYAILVDGKGNEWIGLGQGLYRRDAGTNDFYEVEDISYDWIFDIYEAENGIIWIASMGNGVWKYDPATKQMKNYPYDEDWSNGLRTNSISAIMEDSKGNIWLSTDRGGLCRYNPDKDNFIAYGIAEGLPDDVVYDVLEDDNGYLWFGTNNGIVKFNPETNEVKTFNSREGLIGNQYNYHAALKGENGYFYFGGTDGLVAFNPSLDVVQDSIAPVYFTSLKISNEIVPVGDGSPLESNIIFTDEIELSHNQSTFSLSVSSPSYDIQSSPQYSYRMRPIDNKWSPIDDSRIISFANLSSGSYILDVKISNGTAESCRSIRINILPPWYATIWAKMLYLLFIVGAGLAWFRWYHSHKEKQLVESQNLFAIKKEKELFASKVQFFTEIAHEIRTPLTLIGSPLEAIEGLGIKDAKLQRYLNVMRKNTDRLLDLTGQLLDFQKLGASRMTLKYENVDVADLLSETLDRFEPAISLKHKILVRNIPAESIEVSIDKEAITKILSNLINNALKYSRRTIIVYLTADEHNFVVKVISDSEKLSKEDAVRIFEPFYQKSTDDIKGGVGIGLPLSRQLATLHNGTIVVEDNDAPDNTFVLTIPINQEGVMTNNQESVKHIAYEADDESNQAETKAVSYSLLLVEDNDEMRDFVSEQLSYAFVVETACNGKEALEKLHENHFDIIVTDIMMPEMDGFELCTTIKADVDLSHIPVIFLTAKHDLDSKVRALQCGGESFIEKPFSIKFFKQQIQSLLDNRKRERESFLKKPFFKVDNMKMNKADEEFMNKVIAIIDENISDDNFSVESMAGLFCMSRSSLLRKIKTLFNLSPVELIRLVRLKKAAELIQEGKYRIGDVCFMVGINSLSYFSKLFFKQFGITPKDFEKQCQKNTKIILTTQNEISKNEDKQLD